ncbi:MAG: hypothetical protein LKK00_06900 [Intestinimonas sp.]|jgi:hypothetical protein|nr:hypothetical protein [Intestinimonas sp.]
MTRMKAVYAIFSKTYFLLQRSEKARRGPLLLAKIAHGKTPSDLYGPLRINYQEGDEKMDLKNQQITVGELLDDPAARGVLKKRLGKLMDHPLVPAARTLTLEQVLGFAKYYVPQPVIQNTLRELQRL